MSKTTIRIKRQQFKQMSLFLFQWTGAQGPQKTGHSLPDKNSGDVRFNVYFKVIAKL